MAIETLRPDAAGDVTTLDHSGAANNWECVDEAVADGFTTYVYKSGTSGYDLYNLPASSGVGTINFIKIYIVCRKITTSIARVKIKTNGTEYDNGVDINLTSSFVSYSHQWNTNPSNAHAWTWEEIDALQIGVYLRDDGDSGNACTQVYVEVDYTVGVDVTIEVPLATIASQAYAPAMSLGTTLSPPAATIAGQGYAPSLSLDKVISIPTALITGQAFAPSITEGQGVTISVPLAIITGLALAPSLSLGITISPPVATIAGLAYASSLRLDKIISIPTALITGLAHIPTISLDVTISPPVAVITGLALAPILSLGTTITVPVALITGEAFAPRVLNMRVQAAVRNLEVIRILPSVREDNVL